MNAFLSAYIACALWSTSANEDGDSFEYLNYDESDLAPETLAKMKEDCENFQNENRELLEKSGLSDEQAGHYFWLTREGHGSGFWDRYSQTTCERYNEEQAKAMETRDFSLREALKQTCDCPYHVCARLSEAAKAYDSFDLYIGDDDLIHSN